MSALPSGLLSLVASEKDVRVMVRTAIRAGMALTRAEETEIEDTFVGLMRMHTAEQDRHGDAG